MDKFEALFISWVAAVSWRLLMQNGCIMYRHKHFIPTFPKGATVIWSNFNHRLLGSDHILCFCSDPFLSTSTQTRVTSVRDKFSRILNSWTRSENVARSKGHMSAVLSNVLQNISIYRDKQVKGGLWFCHITPAPFRFTWTAPLGSGRKGLHLFSWNAWDYCGAVWLQASPLKEQTRLTFVVGIARGHFVLANASFFCVF